MKKKILINASNLHVGGGVQVATSVIGELTVKSALPKGLTVWASDVVDANLRKLGYDLSTLPEYEVVNSFGLRLLNSHLAQRMQNFDAIMTIFGPLYIWKPKAVNITGFAQPWIIYPNNEIHREANWHQRIINNLKFSMQKVFFRRADILVAELDHVYKGLLKRNISNPRSIRVVRNCLSSLYFTPSKWQSVSITETQSQIRLGFLGRNYTHKNTRIFPKIIDILRRDYGISASIHVTFTDEEWEKCDDYFRSSISNVGPLFVAQCPDFYQKMDAIIFPSLLECFSATPLEAMAMERPLFASNRPFNRDICAEYAFYFDPMDPTDAAAKIHEYLQNKDRHDKRLKEARKHALEFSNAKDRANQYLQILMSASKK